MAAANTGETMAADCRHTSLILTEKLIAHLAFFHSSTTLTSLPLNRRTVSKGKKIQEGVECSKCIFYII